MTKNGYQNRIELLQGTLDMLILKTLQWGEQHGYGISQAIRATSNEVLQVETGSLYPALHRLERQRWVKSEWKLTESKQRAKYYQLTALGSQAAGLVFVAFAVSIAASLRGPPLPMQTPSTWSKNCITICPA